jgi:nucleoside phosphorylase/CheY-like chemotaxis protein
LRILIIHDRREIGEELQRIARETVGATAEADLAEDVLSARDRLKSQFYDLVVIDLTLPIKQGKASATLENTEILLEDIFEGDEVRTPADVLGISKDSTVLDLVRTNIGQHLMGCLEEDASGTWREAFKAKVQYLMRARSARRLVTNSSHDVDAVLLTALDKEAQPYSEFLELSPSEDFKGSKDFTFADRSGRMRRGILHSIGQAGQSACGSATQALLTQFRPKLIMLTGFCGGVEARVNFGDLVAFLASSAWDYGKWEEVDGPEGKLTVFRPRPMALNCPENGVREVVRSLMASEYSPDADALATVVKASDGKLTEWKLRLRGAGSGSAVVTSGETLKSIVDRDEEIWAIDMESYAFYHACRHTPVLAPDFICLKAVADHCNGEKDSKFHSPCSAISARFAHEVVTRHYDFGA